MATPEGGQIFATINGNYIQSGARVPLGSTVEFYAVLDLGYRISAWSLSFVGFNAFSADNLANEIALPTFTLNNIMFDHHISVSFEQYAEYFPIYFEAAPYEGGTIQAFVNDIEILSGDFVIEGSDVLFVAAPNEYWEVSNWTVNGLNSSETANELWVLDIQAETKVEVLFAEVPLGPHYILVNFQTFLLHRGETQFTATVLDRDLNLLEDVELTWTVTDEDGYLIDGVSINQNGLLTIANTVAFGTEIFVRAAYNEYVYGTAEPLLLVDLLSRFNLNIEGEGTADVSFNIHGALEIELNEVHGGSLIYLPQGTRVFLTANAAEGYRLVGWQTGFAAANLDNSNPRDNFDFQMPPHGFEITVTLIFEPIPNGDEGDTISLPGIDAPVTTPGTPPISEQPTLVQPTNPPNPGRNQNNQPSIPSPSIPSIDTNFIIEIPSSIIVLPIFSRN
jgi:hypothetical protein